MVFHSRHRPLEAYSRALEASGFVIDAIREHRIPEDGLRSDRSRRWRRIALFLHVRAAETNVCDPLRFVTVPIAIGVVALPPRISRHGA
jgi:hypothetical protein